MKTKEDQLPSQIISYLYIGNKSHAKSLSILQQCNIKYILNCTPKRNDDPENGCPNYFEKEKRYSFIYKRIPIYDNRGENIVPYIDIVYKFIEESRHYGNILVHCHKGISRSVSMVIGYLMKKNELTYDEALNHIRMFRPIAQPNESFEQQLRSYQPSNSNDYNSAAAAASHHNLSEQNHQGSGSEPSIGPCIQPNEVVKDSIKAMATLLSGHESDREEHIPSPLLLNNGLKIASEAIEGVPKPDSNLESEQLRKKPKLSVPKPDSNLESEQLRKKPKLNEIDNLKRPKRG